MALTPKRLAEIRAYAYRQRIVTSEEGCPYPAKPSPEQRMMRDLLNALPKSRKGRKSRRS